MGGDQIQGHRVTSVDSLATTFDGNNYRLYVNGELKKTREINTPFDITTNMLKVGLKPAGWDSDSDFGGCVTQVEVWDSVANFEPVYVQGQSGSNECPIGYQVIQDEATCKKAVDALPGKQFESTFPWATIQSGCFGRYEGADGNKVWFNSHASGTFNPVYSNICVATYMR